MSSLKAKHIITLLCIPLIPMGISMCLQGMDNIRQAETTTKWPTVPGIITYSKVSFLGPETRRITDSNVSALPTKHKIKINKPVIKYKYLVKSVQYENNNIYWGDDQIPNVVSYADEMVAKYSPRQKVVIYYNPIDPQKALLETGVSQVSFQTLVYGSILTAIGFSLPLIFFVFDKLLDFGQNPG